MTEGTFDAYSYQTVERKQRFISQLMSSKSPAREAADLDADVVTLANIKALATGDPDIHASRESARRSARRPTTSRSPPRP